MGRHRHDLAPGVRAGMNVGSVRDEHLHDVGMLLRDRPHQRRLAARGARIHVGPFGDQLFDDDGTA